MSILFPQQSASSRSMIEWLVVLAGGLVSMLGLAVMVGWYFHLTKVVQLNPAWSPMQCNTALSFFLTGMGLMMVVAERRWLVLGCGLMVLLMGGLSTLEHLGNWNLLIDELFLKPFIRTAQPGRMAMPTAVGFTMTGLALSLLGWKLPGRNRGSLVIAILGSLVVALSSMGVIGYATGLNAAISWGQISCMAFHSAVGFLLTGSGLFLLSMGKHCGNQGLRHRWLPLPVAVLMFTSTLIMWRAECAQERQAAQQRAETVMDGAEERAQVQVTGWMKALARMASRLDSPVNLGYDFWERDAQNYVTDIPSLMVIERVDPAFKIAWVAPDEGNEDLVGQDFSRDQIRRTAMEMSRVQNRPIISSETKLIKGGRGVLILAPVTKAGRPDGFVAGVFQSRELFKTIVPSSIATGYDLVLSEKGLILGTLGRLHGKADEVQAVVRKIKLPGATWELKAWPDGSQTTSSGMGLSTLVLAFGLLGTLLLPLTVLLGQRARGRADELLGEIVARESVEAALRSSHALQQAILDGANFSIISTDPQGTILSFNRAAERMLGYQAGEVVGKVTPAIIHDADEVAARADELSRKYGRTVEPGFEVFVMESRSGEASEREWTYLRKDGSRLPVLLSVTALFNQSGEISRYLGIAVDMTEKRQAEEKRDALLKNLENLNLALDQHGIVSFADENGLITRVNDRFCEISGYTQEELLGHDLSVLYSGHHPPAFYQEMWDTLRSGKIWKGEVCNRAKDGSLYWVDAVMVPFLDAKGKPYQYVAIRTDITGQKRAGIEMAKARDLAVESARLKAEFLANMSHEIRTPMNGVIGMTDLLLDSGLSGRQLVRAQSIRNSAEALMVLLNDILDFSKIEAGKLSFDTVDFNLREVVEDCLDLMAGAAQKKEILLGSIFEPGVPEEVRGDPTRMRQVISNLVGNAIKFTAEGEVVLRVDAVEVTETEAMLRLEVRDTGIGIAPEAVQRLFKPFVQADGSTTRKFGGTGLGLAISRQLVQMMDGDIEVRSELGKGSTFICTIRLERQQGDHHMVVEPKANLQGLRALVVDDRETNRIILEHQITAAGMEVAVAENGPEALLMLLEAAMSGRPYDVAILDMNMEGMNGLELAREIKSDPAVAPVKLVLCSSIANPLKESELMAHGFAASLEKPVRHTRLLESLARALGKLVPAKRPTESMVARVARPERILLVEDNATNREVVLGALEKLGLQADIAVNGREALARMETGNYPVILMDCQMPEMDGYEATQLLRQREAAAGSGQVRVIAMTANAMRGDREKCLEAGMDDYVAKPMRFGDLQAALVRAGMLQMEEKPREPESTETYEPLMEPPRRDSSLINYERLEEVSFNDEEQRRKLLDLYFADLAEYMDQLEPAIRSGNLEKVVFITHRCGGASESIGITGVAIPLRKLEQMAKAGRLENARALWHQAMVNSDQARTELVA